MRRGNEQGFLVVAMMAMMIFLCLIIFGMFGLSNANLARAKSRVLSLQAQYSAESGADAAIAVYNGGNTSYTGTGAGETQVLSTNTYRSTYTTTVSPGSNGKEIIINATGKVYQPANTTTAKFVHKVRVTAQRSSTTTASSMLSRNILAIDSSVKNVTGKDVFVNGYITMAKNTTNFTAENITVAGKNTGASNCSIGGTGNLIKPTSFTNSGQTKTNINVAYNNCISPPGNSSNSDFNVSANQTSITTVQSTYIPWSQYMDNGYTSGNCSDWTTGGTTRTIPSTSASKKTQYPDSGSNISTSCGSSGDLALGSNQYNIADNVHVRASFCAATACNPTFYNPDSTMKYMFIEGSVNFDSVQTASGSGPITLILYGADPASKTSVCPYGGSFYLGNGGQTAAPALFVLATNGVCLDKTKFGAAPAMGGVAGKNIYISTNSGSPFDLGFNTSFPVNQIPTDLSWRAVRYQRLF